MRAILTSFAALAALSLTAAPASASAEACAVAPERLRTLAATADADTQRRALRNIALGEQLCEARNRSEAARKFNQAARSLGTELAAVLAGATTTAAVQ